MKTCRKRLKIDRRDQVDPHRFAPNEVEDGERMWGYDQSDNTQVRWSD